MSEQIRAGTGLDEALMRLGYRVAEGRAAGLLRVWSPDGIDAGELSTSECWAYLRDRHRDAFESDPPAWDEERHGPFRIEFDGFCQVCGYGIFNGRHECAGY